MVTGVCRSCHVESDAQHIERLVMIAPTNDVVSRALSKAAGPSFGFSFPRGRYPHEMFHFCPVHRDVDPLHHGIFNCH